ncbi:MAG TPA: SRPBCC domain-containing protein [Acidobacteriaceae bacterium]|nr:SRPBCC domain-containing protein [Acidobacteriaceae bacterium]
MVPSASAVESPAEFVFSRTFDACREYVWNAFTQPEHLKHWWGTPGSSIEIVRHELRPGGIFHYRMKFPDGRAMWARFIFREIVAPERLVWLNGFSDEQGGLTRNPWVPTHPLETLNTVALTEQGDKTLLTITVVPFNASDEEARVFAGGVNGMKMGFGTCFKVLADYLARRS